MRQKVAAKEIGSGRWRVEASLWSARLNGKSREANSSSDVMQEKLRYVKSQVETLQASLDKVEYSE
jgi:hypothetical protein